jgi:secondary thiamine-phosphate synthase enzyme
MAGRPADVQIHHGTIDVQSDARVTFHDITLDVAAHLERCGISSGIAVVSSPHTTCSVVIQEESHDMTHLGVEYLMQDLVDTLRRVIPDCTAEGQYLHPGPQHIDSAMRERSEEAWWSLNVDAHLRSVILGRSESVPVVDGALALGEFGRIYFADFDQMRARRRTVLVIFMGESSDPRTD